MHLQQYPDDNILWELRQEAHSLRGDSRNVGVETVEVISHQIEEIIGHLERQEIPLSTEVRRSLENGIECHQLTGA